MISYGTEHWSAGSDEPENRRDMDWDSIDPKHIEHISTLAEFRKQFPVLKEGMPQILHASQDRLVVSQTFEKEQSMLLINRSSESMDIPIDECGGVLQVLLGGLTLGVETSPTDPDEAFYPAKVTTVSSLEFVLPAPTHIPPNAAMLLTCNARKQRQTTQTLTINISGKETAQPRLVGSLPELGGWNPNDGVNSVWTGDHWSAQITIPDHKVSAFKLVYQTDNGFQWEDGGNRFLHSDTTEPIWIR